MGESNKEESLRAIQISERKFASRDLKSAKKFALKAEKLFPSLETSQLVSTLDVYISSENRYGNESDWYGVLNIPPFSDEETVKKQYRKLALHLHPDKNKSVGAEGAFKLISQAWSVLSDSNSKSKYDQKRRNNTVISSSSGKSSSKRSKNNTGTGTGTGTAIRTGVDTFWTSCNRCRMQYEYLRVYLNHNLLCPNCHNAFMAVETGFPCNGNSNPGLGFAKTGNSNPAFGNYENNNNSNNNTTTGFQWETQPTKSVSHKANRRKHEESNTNANTYAYNYEYNYANNNNNNASGNYNFDYNSGGNANNYNFSSEKPAVKRPGRPPKRRRYSFGETSYNSGINTGINTGTGIERPVQDSETLNGFAQMSNNSSISNNNNNSNNYGGNYVNNFNSSSRMPYKRNSFRDLSQADIRNILMEKSRDTISKKLNEFHISTSKKPQESETEEELTNNNNNNYENSDFAPVVTDLRKVVKVVGQPASISVPDPDFYDFDKDRTEKSFENDQVWATYDSEDGMPRLYALVQKILTKKPFSIRMSFLNSKSNLELGPINWVGSGFTKTCGDFRVGRYQVTDTANIFSHRVHFEKGPRGIIKILPQKGETWALYKNWTPNWNELTPDETIYKYEIVEILSDFDWNSGIDGGISVIPMVKVAGFKAVFCKHCDERETFRVPKEEMFRFSHGIPSRVLNGDEGENAPKGCRELDPAATPVELLKIINE